MDPECETIVLFTSTTKRSTKWIRVDRRTLPSTNLTVYNMSDAPTRYTSYVYPMLHNMCTRHTRHTRPARRTYCADYLQSDARGEVLTPT